MTMSITESRENAERGYKSNLLQE